MSIAIATRDYSLVGPESEKAVAAGLASAKWYVPPITRAELKELMRRKDEPAIRDTLIWFAALIVSGALGYYFSGGWAAAPFFLVYGVLYGSASDSRWHECGHGTAFKTSWMNEAVYQIASFMIIREPAIWRWSHTRHHTDTIIVGRDPEIITPRPPEVASLLLNVFALKNSAIFFQKLFLHAAGRMTEEEATFVPESERWKVYRTARVYLAIYAAVVLACVYFRSILPAMYIGLPTLYGGWLSLYFGVTQHLGLAEDVLDHRLNSRTIYMNPIFRFLYWNMNYHVEHHIFPTVPYHALPKLHEAIKTDCPPPYPSTIAAYREIIPALARQLKDPTHFVRRELPVRQHVKAVSSGQSAVKAVEA
jgi:fatty acid desaturase